MTLLFLRQQKQCVGLTLLFLVLHTVLFLMHQLIQHWVERGGNSSLKSTAASRRHYQAALSVLSAMRPYGAGYVQFSLQSSKWLWVLQGKHSSQAELSWFSWCWSWVRDPSLSICSSSASITLERTQPHRENRDSISPWVSIWAGVLLWGALALSRQLSSWPGFSCSTA